MIRGGAGLNYAWYQRASYRFGYLPEDWSVYFGSRFVLEVK